LGLSAERYAFLVEESGEMISTHQPGDWAYTAVNARVYDLLGYQPEELMGTPAYYFFHPQDAEAMKQRTIPAVYAHGTRMFRYRHRHKDGHYLWVESTHRSIRDAESGELKEIITVSRDMTAQVEAEMAASRLAMIAESSADLLLFCDQSLAVSYMNGSARQAFELPEGDYPPLTELLLQASCLQLSALFEQVISEKKSWQGQQIIELAGGQASGQDLVLELQELQLHDENALVQERCFFGLIVRDLTEQRRSEQLERERQQELARASRLMNMGEMATGLAHEINQPLATILNYSRGALRRIDSGKITDLAEIAPLLLNVSRQAQRAADIIKRLRSLVKKLPYQRKRFCVNDTCREVLFFLQHDLQQAGIEVALALQEPLPDIEADTVQIEQVLINLLRNALEAYESSAAAKRRIVISTWSGGEAVLVRVEDFAGGIGVERRSRIFEPHYTTKETGLGMGLSISRSIVEALSGSISLNSDGRERSCFELRLPAAAVGMAQQSGEHKHH
jgi:two-component system sensor kinase FixL